MHTTSRSGLVSTKALNLGYQAGLKGVALSGNPYSRPYKRKEWEEGWKQARFLLTMNLTLF